MSPAGMQFTRRSSHQQVLIPATSQPQSLNIRLVGQRRSHWTLDQTATRDVRYIHGAQFACRCLPLATALTNLALPADALLAIPLTGAKLKRDGAFIRDPKAAPRDLGPAEKSVAQLETQLAAAPFAAPDADTLKDLRLGTSELAAAERAGRLLRIDSIVLLPSAPHKAADILAQLPGEFTLSEARQALDTTRRIAVPLLEYMDSKGLTKRTSETTRVVT